MSDSDQCRAEEEIERFASSWTGRTRTLKIRLEGGSQPAPVSPGYRRIQSIDVRNLCQPSRFRRRRIPRRASRKARQACSPCWPMWWTTGPRAAATGNPPGRTWKRRFCQALLCADKQITERSAVVTHDPLPRVTGDFEILTKVLHHLIRNAIEYCVAPSPRVHISSRRAGSRLGFLGAGQRPWHRARIPKPNLRGFQAPARKRTTPETDWGWHSARRPSSGMAGEYGSSRRPGRDRHSISLCLRPIDTLNESRIQVLLDALIQIRPVSRRPCRDPGRWKRFSSPPDPTLRGYRQKRRGLS